MLREATELAFACGASVDEVSDAVQEEIIKQRQKKIGTASFGIQVEHIMDEVADTRICLEVVCGHTGVDQEEAIDRKMPILWSRKWAADEHGVLWRRER
jgi:hypothetical protein